MATEKPVTVLEPEEPRELARVPSSPRGFLEPRTLAEAREVAEVIASSTLVPTRYQGKPNDIIIAIAYGREVGLAPLAAVQSIAVIGGTPRVFGDGFLGIIQASPRYAKHREYYILADGTEVDALAPGDLAHDGTTAVSLFWVRGNPEPYKGTFSIADAKRAKLWSKGGNWTEYPARMLMWRARGFAGRNGFSAELKGLHIVGDDEGDERDDAPASTPVVMPLRRSEKNASVVVPGDRAGTIAETAYREQQDAASSPPEFLTNELPEPRDTRRVSTPPTPPTPASAKPSTTNGEVLVAPAVTITDTQYIPEKEGEPAFFEIRAKNVSDPMSHIFLTRDKTLYELAVSAEGTPQSFRVTWQSGKRPNGMKCKILESITAS